jgi:hypothetical protein
MWKYCKCICIYQYLTLSSTDRPHTCNPETYSTRCCIHVINVSIFLNQRQEHLTKPGLGSSVTQMWQFEETRAVSSQELQLDTQHHSYCVLLMSAHHCPHLPDWDDLVSVISKEMHDFSNALLLGTLVKAMATLPSPVVAVPVGLAAK